MRRIDVIGIGLGLLAIGAALYYTFQLAGLDGLSAGVWSQALLVGGLIIWLLTYLFRVATNRMTYKRQLENYQEAVLTKKLAEMSPEELEKMQLELEREKEVENSNSDRT